MGPNRKMILQGFPTSVPSFIISPQSEIFCLIFRLSRWTISCVWRIHVLQSNKSIVVDLSRNWLSHRCYRALHAMHARYCYGSSVCLSVCLSVCPSVCQTNAGIVSKRMNISPDCLALLYGHNSCFLNPTAVTKFSKGR